MEMRNCHYGLRNGKVVANGKLNFDFLEESINIANAEMVGEVSFKCNKPKLFSKSENVKSDKFESFTNLKMYSLIQFWNGEVNLNFFGVKKCFRYYIQHMSMMMILIR